MKKRLPLPWLACLMLTSGFIVNDHPALATGQTLSASYVNVIDMGSSINNNQVLSKITLPEQNIANKAIEISGSVVTSTDALLACTLTRNIPERGSFDHSAKDISESAGIASDNCINLNSGNVLISPDRDIAIRTAEGIVSIGSGATIFVISSLESITIYDLNQTKSKQVSVLLNRHRFSMEPGHMLVLTRQKAKNFEELDANCHRVSYRRPIAIELQGEDMTAFTATFSMTSALVRIMPLKQLFNSSEKSERLLLDRLVKTAVILGT